MCARVGITRRHADGCYRLTPYGDLIRRQLQEIDFTSKHMDYFTSHTLAHLPAEYVKRIGDLTDSTHTHDAMDFIHIIEKMIGGARARRAGSTIEYSFSSTRISRS